MSRKVTIEQYLEKTSSFVDNDYGQYLRSKFADNKGLLEMAMLVCPSKEELEEFKRAVAIMTADEKLSADKLTDEQVRKIAEDAQVDPANLAIFFNGYALYCKKAKQEK